MRCCLNCRPTGGESIAELGERVTREVWRLAELNDGKTILVATHATPIRTLIREWVELGALSEPRWVGNASVTIARYDSARREVEVELLCENGFLGNLASE